MSEVFRYKAFISYSHSDKKWAEWLHRALETYRVPKRVRRTAGTAGIDLSRISPVFKDREELATATNLSNSIENALLQSRCLIVVCSPRSAKSRWVNEEVKRFQALGRAEQVYCLIVDGDPTARAGSSLDCFAPALRISPDGSADRIEPLAADVRSTGDGRSEARLKIVAGILGIGLDDLKQRELHRRNRRLVVISSASVAGMALAAVLTTATLLARQEAERQRGVAEREAETATQTAEFLVDLFSVVDPSESRGRSITAYEILETGRERISDRLKDQPEVRNRLLTTMGRVYTGLGIYDTALEILQDGAGDALSQPLEREVALGNAFYLDGDYTQAGEVFTAAVHQVDQLEREGAQWGTVHSDAIGGLANVYIELDRLEEAEGLYRRALESDRARWGDEHEQVAKSLAGLATVYLFLNQLDYSESFFRQALAIHMALNGAEHPQTINTLVNIGSLHYMKDDRVQALRLWEQALPPLRKIFGDRHPESASLLNNIGRIYLLRGDWETAKGLLTESVEIDRSLGREHHDDLVFALNSLGLAKVGLNELAEARALYDEALSLARGTSHPMLGQILVNRADLVCLTNPEESALSDLTEARDALIADHGEGSWRLAIHDNVRGACLAALGQGAEGQPLLQTSYERILNQWGPDVLYTIVASARLNRIYTP